MTHTHPTLELCFFRQHNVLCVCMISDAHPLKHWVQSSFTWKGCFPYSHWTDLPPISSSLVPTLLDYHILSFVSLSITKAHAHTHTYTYTHTNSRIHRHTNNHTDSHRTTHTHRHPTCNKQLVFTIPRSLFVAASSLFRCVYLPRGRRLEKILYLSWNTNEH